jgi:hypothetical protein
VATVSMVEILNKIDENYETELKAAETARERRKKQVEATFFFVTEGKKLHFDEPENWWDAVSPHYEITDPKKFRIVHQIVGTLERSSMEPADQDRRKRLVRVYLKPKNPDFHHITFSFVKRLPRGTKCDFKKVVETRTVMVCNAK